MKNLLIASAFIVSTSGPVYAQTLARVGGVSITLEQVVAADPAAKSDLAAQKKTLIALINRQAVLNEARKSGLLKSEAYKTAVSEAKDNVAINMLAQKFIHDHPLSDEQISAAYKKVFGQVAPQEYRYRLIVVDSYSGAQAILEKLKNGTDFSILAAQLSKDASADLGGEMGWQGGSRIPAPLLKVMKTMKDVEIAGPISIPQGYAVVQLLGKRSAPKPPLDQVKSQLVSALQRQEWINEIVKLRSNQGAQLMVPLTGN